MLIFAMISIPKHEQTQMRKYAKIITVIILHKKEIMSVAERLI